MFRNVLCATSVWLECTSSALRLDVTTALSAPGPSNRQRSTLWPFVLHRSRT
jgi:hypothetical protein